MTDLTKFQNALAADNHAIANVPNPFLNAAQRKIIIDWIVSTEEETSLMDGLCTQADCDELREELESTKNPDLRNRMKDMESGLLNNRVRKAAAIWQLKQMK